MNQRESDLMRWLTHEREKTADVTADVQPVHQRWSLRLRDGTGTATYVTGRAMTIDEFRAHLAYIFCGGVTAFRPLGTAEWLNANES